MIAFLINFVVTERPPDKYATTVEYFPTARSLLIDPDGSEGPIAATWIDLTKTAEAPLPQTEPKPTYIPFFSVEPNIAELIERQRQDDE